MNEKAKKVGKLLTDNISVRGFSHINAEKECQDHSLSWSGDRLLLLQKGKKPPKYEPYLGVIVCDGHGGEKYFRSAKGSEIACKKGKECISAMLLQIVIDPSNYKRHFNRLETEIVKEWKKAVKGHLKRNPFEKDPKFEQLSDENKASLIKNPIKAYGSTFIAAVLTDKYYFIIKLGDGNANVVQYDGEVYSPTALEDSQLEFNLTTSLCQTDAVNEFKHVLVTTDKKTPVNGIILTTDGIINCFRSVEAYQSLIKNIYRAYLETENEKDIEKARLELRDGLNQLSEKGSGDDLSVAIAIR